jgi:hypothetical protein
MTKGDHFPFRTGRDHIADLDFPVVDHYPIDQQLYQLSALGKAELIQGRLYTLAKSGDPLGERGNILLLFSLRIQLPQLLLQTLHGFLQLLALALEFFPPYNLCQIDIQQPGLLALQLRQRVRHRLPADPQRLRQPYPCLKPAQFVRDQCRLP